MWVIPKNLRIYRSAQAMGALISDSQELSEQLEQSVLWRSKPSASKTWSRRLKVGGSTPRLFSQTLKNSLGSPLVEEWTSSLEASLVSHFQAQDEEQETKTQDTCGLTSQTESNDWEDLPLFCLKTSKASSVVNSRATTGVIQKTHRFCSMSSESWRDWVTTRRREYSQRVKSARPIKENESSFWVCARISGSQDALLFQGYLSEGESCAWGTPRVGIAQAPCGGGNPNSKEFNFRLENQVQPTPRQEAQSSTPSSHQELRNWATPTAGTKDHMGGSLEYYRRRSAIGKQIDINGQVLLSQWATPTSRDYKGKYPQWIQEDPTRPTRSLLPYQAHLGTYKGKLNPRWVETLMGLPVGWTMPSCANPWTIALMNSDCWEMESCQAQPRELSESYGTPLTLDELYAVNDEAIRKHITEYSLVLSEQEIQQEVERACFEQRHNKTDLLWATPPASQRGDTMEVYLRKSIKRLKEGGQPFAPTLQVAVEIDAHGLSTSTEELFFDLNLDHDTEELIQKIIHRSKLD